MRVLFRNVGTDRIEQGAAVEPLGPVRRLRHRVAMKDRREQRGLGQRVAGAGAGAEEGHLLARVDGRILLAAAHLARQPEAGQEQ